MIRYVIALFLINTYSRSLGAPADPQQTSYSVADLLKSLSKNCGNLFIRAEIEKSLQKCSLTDAAADHKRLFECLLFYDINSQLCSAINNTKIIPEEEFSAQVNKPFNVKDLCNSAIDWQFTSNNSLKGEFSIVFQDIVKCEKICGVEDVFSTDSIYICKYFDWGWKKLALLKKPTSQTHTKGSSSGAVLEQRVIPAVQSIMPSGTPNLTNVPDQKDLDDIEVTVLPNLSLETNLQANPLPTDKSAHNPTKNDQAGNENENSKPSSEINAGLTPTTKDSKHNFTSQPIPQQEQVPLGGVGNRKHDDETGDDNLGNADVSNEVAFIVVAARPTATSMNAKEIEPDDEDNADDGDLGESPVFPKEIQSGEFSHKEFYTPDLTPEDDHFFPFFLTAIVLVVLAYILYHNKGKVTKVFLGLIVEGRQNGRRRNSRGHAYRRLDTLEQAMSGNLSAQPSKIIY